MNNVQTVANNWHCYPLVIADQQEHITRSEQLLSSVQPGSPAILYWSLAQPAGLVLGFSQKPDVLNPRTRASLSLPIYHRRAGGTAVLVGPDLLSLDVLLPAGHPLILADVVESYRWFGEAWVATLREFGITSRAIPPDEAHAQRTRLKQPETRTYESLMNRACYGTVSPYEVVVGQRKVVGLDMIRRRAGSLLQAGVLLHWETDTLAELLGHTAEEQELLRTGLYERAVAVDELAGHRISAKEIITVFERIVTTPASLT